MSVHNLNDCIQFGQVCTIWKSVEIWTSVYNLDECVQFGRVGTIWTSVYKDPAQLNAALVIHLPLPIYNVRGASLH